MAAGLPFQPVEEGAGGLVAAQHGGGGPDGGLAVPGAQLALVVAQIVAGVFMDTAHGRQHGGQRAQVGRQPLRIPAARAMQRVQDAAGGHFRISGSACWSAMTSQSSGQSVRRSPLLPSQR